MPFSLPELPYPPQALEPHIDSRTMEIHHGKHHAAYTNNLNAAIKDKPEDTMSIEDILKNLDMTNMPLRNNGGGFYNHCLFWELMSPHGGGNPNGNLSIALERDFGSFDTFKEKFAQAAVSRFGSGWAWLCVHPGGKLEICSTPNQDNPLMPNTGCGGYPIIGLDVWEHAYYLLYQNRRPDYIAGFYNVLNWEFAEKRYNSFNS
ncbi:MAG: superoxide dismutase [Saprospiraceae bacterium]|nr:superoxide dismutase [Saprospiraceae bacterium]MBK8451264.1 superoxide dismutase [Saprospiraceae bacterium]MBK8483225.1 superoxide dismutase [Saprospiraceae bacterium]MBK9220737.1 superoxide dismutase [Saprospiraceae bacterium]MBK9722418.1 superoxide dismutase [Saprospiraceae bacterium]